MKPLKILLAAVLLLFAVHSSLATPGDLDFDGKVTNNDAMMCLYYVGGMMPMNSFFMSAADVAGGPNNTPDGHVTIADAERIMRAANGLDDLGSSTGGGSKALPMTDTVTISANLTRNYKLADGFKLSGTLTGPTGPVAYGSISFTATSGTQSFSASVQNGSYSVIVAPGSYTATTAASNYSTSEITSYSLPLTPSTVTVAADTTQNFVEGAAPPSGTISGNITGSNWAVTGLSFQTTSGPYGTGYASVSSQTALASYTMHPVAGSGYFFVSGKNAANANVSELAYLFSSTVSVPANGATTHDIALPALATETGTVTPPAGGAIDSFGVGSPPIGTQDAYLSGFDVSTPSTAPVNYTVSLPPGSYSAAIGLSDIQSGSATLSLGYRAPVTIPAGGGTANFTLPALPQTFTFSGQVTDASNKPLSNVDITLVQTSYPTTGYYASASATTDSTGHFALPVPAGSYSVSISPPPPV